MKYLCLAGNFQQSEYHRKAMGVPRQDWIYASSPLAFHGRNLDEFQVIKTGTWWTHPDYFEIQRAVRYLEIKKQGYCLEIEPDALDNPPEKWYHRVLKFLRLRKKNG